MQILYFLFFVVLFSLIILNFKAFTNPFINRKQLLMMLGIKILAAFCLFYIYTNFYPDTSNADIFKYYNDGEILNQVKSEHPVLYLKIITGIDTQSPEAIDVLSSMNHWFREWERSLYNDNHTIIRLNAIISLVSFGNYHIHALFFCFMSFIGIFLMLKTIFNFMNTNQKLLSYSIFLLPSILIWTSGNLKEPFLFFGMGLTALCSDRLYRNKFRINYLLGLFLGISIMISVKIYIIAFMVPSILSLVILSYKKTNPYILSLLILTILFLIATTVHYIYPSYSIFSSLALKQRDFIGLAKSMNAGSYIELSVLEANPWSFIANIPEALFYSITKPLPWDSLQPLSLIAALENIFIILIMGFSLIYKKKNLPHNTIAAILLFCAILFIFIGLTTPVAGGIVRYKVPALPLILFLCFTIIDLEKITTKFPILKRFTL